MKIKELKKAIKKFDAYDRVYYDGKLSSALMILLSVLALACFILGCIIFK